MSNSTTKEVVPEVDPKAYTVSEDDLEKSSNTYTYVFSKPFTYAGKTYEELTFDFDKLTGKDVLAIMRELRLRSITVASRAFDVEYQVRYAARCCREKIGSDVLSAMPVTDFDHIVNATQHFLAGLIL